MEEGQLAARNQYSTTPITQAALGFQESCESLRVSSLPPPSIHLVASLLWPQKEHSQVASVAWIIKELLKALILSKLNLRSSCNILRAVK